MILGHLTLALLLASQPPPAEPASVRWAESFAAAERQAREKDRPILVKFYTTWCGWCRKMDREAFRDPRVAALSQKDLIFVSLDAEDGGAGSALARKLQVRSFPSVVLLDKNGTMFAGMAGYRPADRFLSDLQRNLGKLRKPDARASAPAELPQDPQVLWDLAMSLERDREFDRAAEHYEALLRLGGDKALRFRDLALWNLAEIYRRTGDRGRAMERYRALVEGFPRSPRAGEALFQAARLSHFMGNLDDAVAGYSRVAEQYPDCGCIEAARKELARILSEVGRD